MIMVGSDIVFIFDLICDLWGNYLPSPPNTQLATSQNRISPNFRSRLVRFPFPKSLITSADTEIFWVESSKGNV